jgi:hypothetical protein
MDIATLLYSIVALLSVGFLGSNWAFSKLIEIEYLQFQDQWIADGRPTGGKARKEANFWSEPLPRELFYRWYSSTPDWVKKSPEAESWYKHLRIWGTLFFVSFFSLIIVIIVLIKK